MAEIYRHTLERGIDPGAQPFVQRLSNGQVTVKELVRGLAKSQEYMQRFGQTEAGEGQPYERAVSRLYRHVLGRQPDENGLRVWARTAQQRGLSAVVDGLIDSAEYNKNFGDWTVPGSGGVRFCQGGGQGDVSSAGPLNNRRFQTMDANNDGVVSRREWNGSAQSFRVHDWNNDGVLSGDEVETGRFRQGRNAEFENFDRGENFEFLDANNNNRIEQREWHMNFREFRQLDSNGDGVLTRAEFVRGTSGTAATTGQSFAVGGDRSWFDTGIVVRVGDNVTINADGQIRLSRNTRDTATAAGSTQGRRPANNGGPMPNQPAGALIAKIAENAPMMIGANRTFRATRAGRLYLGINDDYHEDNTGQYTVTVDVN